MTPAPVSPPPALRGRVRARVTPRAGRRGPRGLTLIEVTIAILIVALLFSAVTVSIGAVTGAKARTSAGELAGVIRSLYETAALTGKTCRLVFELPGEREDEETPVRYHAECAAGNVTTSRDREAALREEGRRSGREDEGAARDERVFQREEGEGPSLEELMTAEQRRVEQAATYQGFTSEAVEPRELPPEVRVAVWTRQQRNYVEQGLAYLYFFPQGFTEKAQVRLTQGDNAWTLTVAPLTGKVTVVSEALEVPRS